MTAGHTGTSYGDTHLELDVWRPGCWTLAATRDTITGLLARGLYTIDDETHAQFTGHGETNGAVDTLVETARESTLTDTAHELEGQLCDQFVSTPGRATWELLVAYPNERSVHQLFVSRGFVPSESVHIRDGRE